MDEEKRGFPVRHCLLCSLFIFTILISEEVIVGFCPARVSRKCAEAILEL